MDTQLSPQPDPIESTGGDLTEPATAPVAESVSPLARTTHAAPSLRLSAALDAVWPIPATIREYIEIMERGAAQGFSEALRQEFHECAERHQEFVTSQYDSETLSEFARLIQLLSVDRNKQAYPEFVAHLMNTGRASIDPPEVIMRARWTAAILAEKYQNPDREIVLIDCGSGDCMLTLAMAALAPAIRKIVALDTDPSALAAGARRLQALQGEYSCLTEDRYIIQNRDYLESGVIDAISREASAAGAEPVLLLAYSPLVFDAAIEQLRPQLSSGLSMIFTGRWTNYYTDYPASESIAMGSRETREGVAQLGFQWDQWAAHPYSTRSIGFIGRISR